MTKPISYKAMTSSHNLNEFNVPKSQSEERKEMSKMATLNETAQAYTPQQTKNISELDKVDVGLEVIPRTFKQGTPDEFSINVVTVDDEDYRVPNSVLEGLKVLLEKIPTLKFFSVLKSGEGMKTKYQVIPYQKGEESSLKSPEEMEQEKVE